MRRDAVKELLQRAGQPVRRDQTDRDSGAGDRHRLSDDQPDDVAHLRAERAADANLARALGDGVGQHAEQADSGDRQREGGECSEQYRVEPRA